MEKNKLSDFTRFHAYFCTDRKSQITVLQFSDNSVIAFEQNFDTGVKTEIRSPLLKNFFKTCQWLKATENLSDRDVYINRINRQID